MLYQKISKKGSEKNAVNTVFAVSRMLVMGKVLYGLHLVSHSIPIHISDFTTRLGFARIRPGYLWTLVRGVNVVVKPVRLTLVH